MTKPSDSIESVPTVHYAISARLNALQGFVAAAFNADAFLAITSALPSGFESHVMTVCQSNQILRPIVELVPVYMVNVGPGQQTAVMMLFVYQPVLEHAFRVIMAINMNIAAIDPNSTQSNPLSRMIPQGKSFVGFLL